MFRKYLFLAAFLVFTLITSRADELADKGRAVFKKNQHVVVTVQLVLKSKVSFGGRGGPMNSWS